MHSHMTPDEGISRSVNAATSADHDDGWIGISRSCCIYMAGLSVYPYMTPESMATVRPAFVSHGVGRHRGTDGFAYLLPRLCAMLAQPAAWNTGLFTLLP